MSQPIRIARTAAGELLLAYADGSKSKLKVRDLRLACPCASCVDEFTGEALLDPASVPQNIKIKHLRTVGAYALAFQFDDGHHTGIYPWSLLQNVSQNLDS